MKVAARTLLCLAVLGATLAHTQSNNIPQVQHVIVVIQENRTPDNLFGSDAVANQRQLPGADLATSGQCSTTGSQTLRPINLGNACDPNHDHAGAWVSTYHSGRMDGACTIGTQNCTISNPEYTYVQSSNVVPYFQIAKQYGYANYMFQTNQGPSFPAHQFLFSGTSAPDYFNDPNSNCGTMYPCYQWFAAENTPVQKAPYGCTAQGTVILDINPGGGESAAYNGGIPCYNHNTLDTLLDNQSGPITWKYYAQSSTPATGLWTAPNAISGLCVLNTDKTSCTGYDWINNVESVFPNSPGYLLSYSPILTDLGADPNQQQCTLPAVSWVVPDGNWSDHAGQDSNGAGPAWVAAIINAVGGYDNSGNKLATNCGYWTNTVVLVTWDDWGGWYDHILPWNCSNAGVCSGYTGGQDGAGSEYVYGFRVPLLVVSAYNYRAQNASGYISGACVAPGNCPNKMPPYIHDFGSILNFIEYAFGNNQQPLHFGGFPPTSGISPSYPYADVFAPDGFVVCGTICLHPYSLSDFFNFGGGPTTFVPFTPQQGINYTTQCFITPKAQACFGTNFKPTDPDADAVDE
jgi:phospholipase C